MQVTGRWKSSQMPAHYTKAALAERGAIARFKDGKAKMVTAVDAGDFRTLSFRPTQNAKC